MFLSPELAELWQVGPSKPVEQLQKKSVGVVAGLLQPRSTHTPPFAHGDAPHGLSRAAGPPPACPVSRQGVRSDARRYRGRQI